MANGIGDTDKVLLQGRIAYGYDGTNSKPVKADTSGAIVLGAGTAEAGEFEIHRVKAITSLFAAASVAASTQVASSVLALGEAAKATVFISHGRAGSAAFGTNGTEYRVQVSETTETSTNTWRTLASVLASSAVCMTAAASSNVAVGATTVVILSGTAVTRGDIIVWPSGTIEWMEVNAPSGTANFTVVDALDFAHNAAGTATLIGGGEFFTLSVDLEAATRMRVLINNNASGTTQAVYSKVACITQT